MKAEKAKVSSRLQAMEKSVWVDVLGRDLEILLKIEVTLMMKMRNSL